VPEFFCAGESGFCEFASAFVDDRERAGLAGADRAHVAVGFGGGRVDDGARAEHFGLGEEFGVDFEADDGFVGYATIITAEKAAHRNDDDRERAPACDMIRVIG
jgi:hypothetical protein